MARAYQGKYDLEDVERRFKEGGLRALSYGEKMAGVKAGFIPPIRSERERQLRSRYNMTLEDYEAMYDEQGGLCAICEMAWTGDLYVDHCHDTGDVRGLPCPTCNTLVGVIEARRNNLHGALRYLGVGEDTRFKGAVLL